MGMGAELEGWRTKSISERKARALKEGVTDKKGSRKKGREPGKLPVSGRDLGGRRRKIISSSDIRGLEAKLGRKAGRGGIRKEQGRVSDGASGNNQLWLHPFINRTDVT